MSDTKTAQIFQKTEGGLTVASEAFTNHAARYGLLIQTFVPRPIAWVLTENENGTHNLAPFSYAGCVDHNPPTLLFSCGMRREARDLKKDTWANLERTGKCVVHIPSVSNMEAVNNSAAGLEVGESEAEEFNIPLTYFDGFDLPRVKDAPVAYGCKLKDVVELGKVPMGLLMVEVEQFYMAEHIVESIEGENIHIDEMAIDPLTRLGKTKYGTLGELHDIGTPPKLVPVK